MSMRRAERNAIPRNAGAALLTALGLLLIFSLLGSGYVGYMIIENDRADLQVRDVRASAALDGAMRTALARMDAALRAGKAPPEEFAFEFPVYIAAPEGLIAHETRRTAVVITATVAPESALPGYWLQGEAYVADALPDGAERRTAPAYAEAVAVFPEDRAPQVLRWSSVRE